MPDMTSLRPAAAALPSLRAWHLRRLAHACAAPARTARHTAAGRAAPARGWAVASASTAESATTEAWSFYDHPELYDAAFSFRDFDEEVDFLEAVFEDNTSEDVKSFLELGCGSANHAIRMAQRGHTVYALDSSRAQLAYARKKAEAAGAAVRFLREDMCDYELPGEATVDLAVCLLGTLAHLQTQEEVLACWEATYNALRPGGLFVIELLHPHEVFDGSFVKGDLWEAELPSGEEGDKVIVEFGTDDDEFDARSQLLRKRVGVSVRRGSDIDLQGEGYVMLRVFTFQELLALSELAGYAVVGAYGDFDLEVDFEHRDASRLLLCLQKPWEEAALVAPGTQAPA